MVFSKVLLALCLLFGSNELLDRMEGKICELLNRTQTEPTPYTLLLQLSNNATGEKVRIEDGTAGFLVHRLSLMGELASVERVLEQVGEKSKVDSLRRLAIITLIESRHSEKAFVLLKCANSEQGIDDDWLHYAHAFAVHDDTNLNRYLEEVDRADELQFIQGRARQLQDRLERYHKFLETFSIDSDIASLLPASTVSSWMNGNIEEEDLVLDFPRQSQLSKRERSVAVLLGLKSIAAKNDLVYERACQFLRRDLSKRGSKNELAVMYAVKRDEQGALSLLSSNIVTRWSIAAAVRCGLWRQAKQEIERSSGTELDTLVSSFAKHLPEEDVESVLEGFKPAQREITLCAAVIMEVRLRNSLQQHTP